LPVAVACWVMQYQLATATQDGKRLVESVLVELRIQLIQRATSRSRFARRWRARAMPPSSMSAGSISSQPPSRRSCGASQDRRDGSDGGVHFHAMRACSMVYAWQFCDNVAGCRGANVKHITCVLLHLRYCCAQPVVGCRGLQQWRRGDWCIGGSDSFCQDDLPIASCACRGRS